MVRYASEYVFEQANANNNKNAFGGIVFNVLAYGAKGDGVTDDTASIQSTINAASQVGGVVLFPSTTSNSYRITKTLTNVTGKLIILRGQGSMIDLLNSSDAPYVPATKILWAGSSDPVLKITGPIGGCSVFGITFDGGGVATYGMLLDTVQFSNFEDIAVRDVTVSGLWLNTNAASGIPDNNINCMYNRFSKLGVSRSPIGIKLDGNPVTLSNTCHNTFDQITILYTGTAGVHYVITDNNTFLELFTLRISGSGYGIQIEAASASEYIFHFQGTANGISGNGGMIIFGYDKTNGQPDPIGENINYTQSGFNASKWSIKQNIEMPTINNTLTAVKGRTVTYQYSTKTALAGTGTNTLSPGGAPSSIQLTIVPIHHYPIGMSISLSNFITSGSFTVSVNANGTPVWSNTVTFPSGNNQFFSFAQNNDQPVPNGQGLTVTIATTGLTPAASLDALVQVIYAV